MKKLAVVFELSTDRERNDLCSKLRTEGFTLTIGTYPLQRIYGENKSFNSGRGMGYLVHHSGTIFHLYVYSTENNPLDEFLRKNDGCE